MKRQILMILAVIFVLAGPLAAQSDVFRAQARYYTALDEFEAGAHTDAIASAQEAKEILDGTNVLIQYVHIMSANEAGRYNEAFEEIQRFFALVENQEEPVNFRRGAQELTDDEVEDILQIFDSVQSHVANRTEERTERAARRAEERAEIAARVDSALNAFERLLTYDSRRDSRIYPYDAEYELSVSGRFPEYTMFQETRHIHDHPNRRDTGDRRRVPFNVVEHESLAVEWRPAEDVSWLDEGGLLFFTAAEELDYASTEIGPDGTWREWSYPNTERRGNSTLAEVNNFFQGSILVETNPRTRTDRWHRDMQEAVREFRAALDAARSFSD